MLLIENIGTYLLDFSFLIDLRISSFIELYISKIFLLYKSLK